MPAYPCPALPHRYTSPVQGGWRGAHRPPPLVSLPSFCLTFGWDHGRQQGRASLPLSRPCPILAFH